MINSSHSKGLPSSSSSSVVSGGSVGGRRSTSIGCRYIVVAFLLVVVIIWAILMLHMHNYNYHNNNSSTNPILSHNGMLGIPTSQQQQHAPSSITNNNEHHQQGVGSSSSSTLVSPHQDTINAIERLQGGPIPLDVYYGNTTPPTAAHGTHNNNDNSVVHHRQSLSDFKSAMRCQDVLGLPPGPDGRGLFNLALAPSQVPAHSLLLSTDGFNTLIFDEVMSQPGNRSRSDYRVVTQDVGDGVGDRRRGSSEYEKMKPHGHRYKGRYGFMHPTSSPLTTTTGTSPTSTSDDVTRLEVYAGLGRWSTWRGTQRDVDGGDGTFSITYLSYISFTWSHKASSSSSSSSSPSTASSPVVRWHPLGALPPMSLPMRAALLKFRNTRFRSPNRRFRKGGMHREGLEDCIFMPPFHYTSPTTNHTTNTSNIKNAIPQIRRRFVICNVGFTFVDGHIFIGEVTSRFEKYNSVIGSSINNKKGTMGNNNGGSPMLFDNEWIPILDDPVPFGVDLSSPSKNNPISMNKNWNAVPCDHGSDGSMINKSGIGGDDDWIVCLQTSVAPVVKTVAYNMDTRKVVGTWESDNGATAPGRLRNGKGVIPLLPHELPPQLQPSSFTTIGTANAVTSSTTTTTTATTHHTNTVVSSTYPKYLSLFHEVMRGHYRSIWGLIDSRAPYPLLVVSTSTPADVQQQPMSLKDDATPPVSTSSSTTTSPFRAYKLTPSKVEYVRSITISHDRSNIYLTFSEDDGRGKMCVVPTWRAIQAAIGNLE